MGFTFLHTDSLGFAGSLGSSLGGSTGLPGPGDGSTGAVLASGAITGITLSARPGTRNLVETY